MATLDIESKIQAIAAVETGDIMNTQGKVRSLVSRLLLHLVHSFIMNPQTRDLEFALKGMKIESDKLKQEKR